jgi:hypothetical protein
MPEPVSGRGGRHVRQTGGEILHAHVHRNEEERCCGLLPSSGHFRLVALLFNQEW